MSVIGTVAVCIPTYRRPQLLARLVRDLVQQTVKPDVLIVVDGDPSSREVESLLEDSKCGLLWRTTYVPSNHANLAYQRYLGWLAAKREKVQVLLYLDDDLRIVQPDAVEKVLLPLVRGEGVVGVTAQIEVGSPEGKLSHAPILLDRERQAGRLLSVVVRRFGSKVPPGELTPSGNRRLPEVPAGSAYAPVRWLRGGVMAFRMDALTEECFSPDLFALTHVGWGKGEDSLISRRVASKGRMLMACNATFLHLQEALPCAYPIEPFWLAHAIAYSRRLINDNYRYPGRPTVRDRLALVRTYLGNILICFGRALAKPARYRFAYAVGYLAGAARGLVSPPRAERLTPNIDWRKEAERALERAVRLGEE
jgi:glycosyltransferase involved in cell wall biosynthesis